MRARAKASSTSATTATWSECASSTGRSSSWSSASRGRCASGLSRLRRYAYPSSSTCARTPSSGPTSPPTPTGIGCSIHAAILGATAMVQGFMHTFEDFPPRQRPASFTIDQAKEALTTPSDRIRVRRVKPGVESGGVLDPLRFCHRRLRRTARSSTWLQKRSVRRRLHRARAGCLEGSWGRPAPQ